MTPLEFRRKLGLIKSIGEFLKTKPEKTDVELLKVWGQEIYDNAVEIFEELDNRKNMVYVSNGIEWLSTPSHGITKDYYEDPCGNDWERYIH
jgi:hypothetical protein